MASSCFQASAYRVNQCRLLALPIELQQLIVSFLDEEETDGSLYPPPWPVRSQRCIKGVQRARLLSRGFLNLCWPLFAKLIGEVAWTLTPKSLEILTYFSQHQELSEHMREITFNPVTFRSRRTCEHDTDTTNSPALNAQAGRESLAEEAKDAPNVTKDDIDNAVADSRELARRFGKAYDAAFAAHSLLRDTVEDLHQLVHIFKRFQHVRSFRLLLAHENMGYLKWPYAELTAEDSWLTNSVIKCEWAFLQGFIKSRFEPDITNDEYERHEFTTPCGHDPISRVFKLLDILTYENKLHLESFLCSSTMIGSRYLHYGITGYLGNKIFDNLVTFYPELPNDPLFVGDVMKYVEAAVTIEKLCLVGPTETPPLRDPDSPHVQGKLVGPCEMGNLRILQLIDFALESPQLLSMIGPNIEQIALIQRGNYKFRAVTDFEELADVIRDRPTLRVLILLNCLNLEDSCLLCDVGSGIADNLEVLSWYGAAEFSYTFGGHFENGVERNTSFPDIWLAYKWDLRASGENQAELLLSDVDELDCQEVMPPNRIPTLERTCQERPGEFYEANAKVYNMFHPSRTDPYFAGIFAVDGASIFNRFVAYLSERLKIQGLMPVVNHEARGRMERMRSCVRRPDCSCQCCKYGQGDTQRHDPPKEWQEWVENYYL